MEASLAKILSAGWENIKAIPEVFPPITVNLTDLMKGRLAEHDRQAQEAQRHREENVRKFLGFSKRLVAELRLASNEFPGRLEMSEALTQDDAGLGFTIVRRLDGMKSRIVVENLETPSVVRIDRDNDSGNVYRAAAR
jgi:hypothetical protein